MAFSQLSSAIEQVADSVVVTNRDGIIVYVNPAFEAIAGFSRDECVGRKTSLLRSGVQTSRFYDRLWGTILSGQPFHSVLTNRRRDGRLFEFEQTITPVWDREGTIVFFVSIGRDVTGPRRAQAARLHHRLEYESRRLAADLHADAGQFLALAHITLADLAHDGPPGVADRVHRVRRYLDSVEGRLRRATQEAHPRLVGDRGLVEALERLAAGCARCTGMIVTVESAIPWRCPSATETLLYRVVQEALGTVARQGGAQRVAVALSREVAGRRANDQAIRCVIRDDGHGFDAQGFATGAKESAGLRALAERLAAIGGRLDVVPVPDATELRAILPLGARE